MSNPSAPNYKKDVGRLVTDRYDFEKHINGEDFRQNADTVDLSPTVLINSTPYETVQSALEAISTSLAPPTIQDATATVKGILKLKQDFGGTADFPQVVGLRTVPVSATLPNLSDVLIYNGTSWAPAALSSTFIASQDLAGTNLAQQVINLTGSSGLVTITANTLQFLTTVTSPTLNQAVATGSSGQNFTIQAQGGSSGNSGGNLILSGGTPGAGSTNGGVQIKLGASNHNLVQLTEPILGQRVLGLMGLTSVTATQMPTGTGDNVIYIGNAVTAPTTGSPVSGSMMYVDSGKLRVKNSDANDFEVGSIQNPSIWGTSGSGTYTFRSASFITTGATPSTLFTYALLDFTLTKVDAIIIGKRQGSTDCVIYNLSDGYVRQGGGSPVQVGSGITSADPRVLGGASSWTPPTISISGNNLLVVSGANTGTTIYWMAIVQLVQNGTGS